MTDHMEACWRTAVGPPKMTSVLSTQDSQMLRGLAQEDRHGSKTYQTKAVVQSLSRL